MNQAYHCQTLGGYAVTNRTIGAISLEAICTTNVYSCAVDRKVQSDCFYRKFYIAITMNSAILINGSNFVHNQNQ